MPQPYNYSVNVQSPFEAALGGLKLGATFADVQAQREMQAQQQAAAQREAERQRMVQENIQALAANPSPSAQDFINVSMLLPEKEAASMRANWDALSKDQQSTELRFGGQVMSAFSSGAPEVGINLLEERANAEENSGRKDRAQAYRTYAEIAKTSPSTAQKTIGIMLAGVPGGDKVLEGIVKVQQEDREQELRPFKLRQETADTLLKEVQAKFAPEKLGLEIQLTQSQIEQAKAARRAQDAAAAKSGAEARRASAEASQMAAGIIPIEKRPEVEGKFRKEYSDQTKGYQEVKSAYGRIKASEDSAVGDISLIFGYMKMLDPGSVVREGEFATAQNASGVPDRIQNIYNKVISGERLNDGQRKAFKGQAEKLYQSAAEGEKTVRTGIARMANGYGLNTANIFYEAAETPPSTPSEGGAAPDKRKSSVVVGGKTYARPANFTDAQWSAYKQAMGAQ